MLRYLLPLLFCSSLSAQEILFPNLSGTELEAAIVAAFKPATVLEYGPARDTMFRKIDSRGDTLTCVYTGYQFYLPPGEDPTFYAFNNGDINTEHIYPRSKGADGGRGESDMHHLAATRVRPNADRGSLPLGEVPDDQTDSWYYLTQVRTTLPPTEIIDLYSEWWADRFFEPREDFKGNAARAVFYFYTMYRNEANAADPDFFAAQRPALCQWHTEDPVDTREFSRSAAIATYQDGKPNPFVVDCSLAQRLYCPEIAVPNCTTNTVNEAPTTIPDWAAWTAAAQPAGGVYWTEFSLRVPARAEVIWTSAEGRIVRTESHGRLAPGTHRLELRAPTGWYVGRLRLWNAEGEQILVRRVVLR